MDFMTVARTRNCVSVSVRVVFVFMFCVWARAKGESERECTEERNGVGILREGEPDVICRATE